MRPLLLAAVTAPLVAGTLSGCLLLAAGAAVGAAGYAYDQGKLTATEEAPLDEVYDAAVAAAADLGVDLEADTHDHSERYARIVGAWPPDADGDRDTLRIELTRQAARTTRVEIRVGLGDEERSRIVLERIRAGL
ncbi:MAG TPA: DUF3568 family protein [Phycisphaerales bacterium]|nr:DUF3568 family protein [Phycisphaerales bacterium]